MLCLSYVSRNGGENQATWKIIGGDASRFNFHRFQWKLFHLSRKRESFSSGACSEHREVCFSFLAFHRGNPFLENIERKENHWKWYDQHQNHPHLSSFQWDFQEQWNKLCDLAFSLTFPPFSNSVYFCIFVEVVGCTSVRFVASLYLKLCALKSSNCYSQIRFCEFIFPVRFVDLTFSERKNRGSIRRRVKNWQNWFRIYFIRPLWNKATNFVIEVKFIKNGGDVNKSVNKAQNSFP